MTADPNGDAGDVAAVDLGSNSFHMIVARPRGAEVTVVDRLREPVRMAAGLDDQRRLSADAHDRAIECLQRFGQRLRAVAPGRARVVGTNTLRRVRHASTFLAEAEAALGHPVEIISGVEEARLIYGGVVHGLDDDTPRRLVIDIGGGSTEVIVGHNGTPRLLESVRMGCVSQTQSHFPDGRITRKRFDAARLAARAEADYLARSYRHAGWDVCLGASGTIRAIAKVIAAAGWREGDITPDAIDRVAALTVDAGHIDALDFDGLRADRRPIFAGGLAVLAGLFDALSIQCMAVSDRALREGVVYDLLGRLSDHDVRHATVSGVVGRFGIDAEHAVRVRHTALGLADGLADGWPDMADADARQLLAWAAELHEIGLFLAHGSYHKHGEYLIRHADLHGFSQTEQRVLAALVRLHRGKFRDHVLEEVPRAWRDRVRRLAVPLRLAVNLRRGRAADTLPQPRIQADGDTVQLAFDGDWLAGHALTREALDREQSLLKAAGLRLKLSG